MTNLAQNIDIRYQHPQPWTGAMQFKAGPQAGLGFDPDRQIISFVGKNGQRVVIKLAPSGSVPNVTKLTGFVRGSYATHNEKGREVTSVSLTYSTDDSNITSHSTRARDAKNGGGKKMNSMAPIVPEKPLEDQQNPVDPRTLMPQTRVDTLPNPETESDSRNGWEHRFPHDPQRPLEDQQNPVDPRTLMPRTRVDTLPNPETESDPRNEWGPRFPYDPKNPLEDPQDSMEFNAGGSPILAASVLNLVEAPLGYADARRKEGDESLEGAVYTPEISATRDDWSGDFKALMEGQPKMIEVAGANGHHPDKQILFKGPRVADGIGAKPKSVVYGRMKSVRLTSDAPTKEDSEILPAHIAGASDASARPAMVLKLSATDPETGSRAKVMVLASTARYALLAPISDSGVALRLSATHPEEEAPDSPEPGERLSPVRLIARFT